MTELGCTLEAMERQISEHSELERSLEDQHVSVYTKMLTFMYNAPQKHAYVLNKFLTADRSFTTKYF